MFYNFKHHFHDHDGHPQRGPQRFAHFFGGGGRGAGGRHEHFGRGFGMGGGRERMFDSGEFQLVILHLLSEKPSYGYELIKTMEEKLAGGYAPSPGVIYPTLTLLEEEGFTTASTSEGARKIYTVTPQGREHLQSNKQRLDEILNRLEETGEGFEGGRSPEFRRAFKNLQRAIFSVAMRARLSRKPLTAEQIGKIIAAMEAATKTIDSL